jgi:hypothetical protein
MDQGSVHDPPTEKRMTVALPVLLVQGSAYRETADSGIACPSCFPNVIVSTYKTANELEYPNFNHTTTP